MQNKVIYVVVAILASWLSAHADTIPSGFSRKVEWRVGAEVAPAFVPGTNGFLNGNNNLNKHVNNSLSGNVRADFSFNPATREGMLYKGLYQGLGLGVNTFYSNSLLGTPVSAYIYQGAPIVRFSGRLWLGYEWQFGAAFGWKHYEEGAVCDNTVVSTPVTAHMGLAVKLHYSVSDRWKLTVGVGANHFSNGNTSVPNSGVNAIGANIGIAYVINPQKHDCKVDESIEADADKGRWLYDIIAYGSWRKRILALDGVEKPQICPGKFGVVGLQFSPIRKLHRCVAVGPALDVQWDESAGLAPYWVEGSYDKNIKFERPPFGKQLSVGVSAHAELIMPIFSVNAGLGYDVVNPKGNQSFYQSLALKAFVGQNMFLNVGYRLGDFKDPQNLMLGIGVRL